MPMQDGTGPAGQGPQTGRGMGPCSQNSPRYFQNPKSTSVMRGMGRGRGFGMGRALRNRGFRRNP